MENGRGGSGLFVVNGARWAESRPLYEGGETADQHQAENVAHRRLASNNIRTLPGEATPPLLFSLFLVKPYRASSRSARTEILG